MFDNTRQLQKAKRCDKTWVKQLTPSTNTPLQQNIHDTSISH